jgi:predicted phage terminase large subunit-like protein
MMLLGMWRGRLEYPELRERAQKLYTDYRDDGNAIIIPDGKHTPDRVYIESKSTGGPLVQDFRRGGIPVEGFDPTPHGDKLARVRLVTPVIAAGRIWLYNIAPNYEGLSEWSQKFLDLCKVFPNSESRDVVDTLTQVLLRLVPMHELKHPKDPEYVPSRGGPKESPYWPGKE